jgi:hypothetical protein
MTKPIEILDRRGPLVRVPHLDGWLRLDSLEPCGSCGGVEFAVVSSNASGRNQRHLRCVKCLPVDARKSERLVGTVMMPRGGALE